MIFAILHRVPADEAEERGRESFAEFTLEERSDEGLRMTLLLVVTISTFRHSEPFVAALLKGKLRLGAKHALRLCEGNLAVSYAPFCNGVFQNDSIRLVQTFPRTPRSTLKTIVPPPAQDSGPWTICSPRLIAAAPDARSLHFRIDVGSIAKFSYFVTQCRSVSFRTIVHRICLFRIAIETKRGVTRDRFPLVSEPASG